MNEDHAESDAPSRFAEGCSATSASAVDLTSVRSPPAYAQWICHAHDGETWCLCLESDEECGCADSATLGADGVVTCLGCDVRLDPIDFDTGEPASALQLAALYAELREDLD